MFLSVEPHQWLCHHFLCIFIYICNKCCYLIIEPHHLLIFYLFFSLFKLFFSILSKKKNLLLSISSHMLLHFLQHFPSFFAYLSPHYSLLYHYTSFIIFSFLYFGFLLSILFCINLISFLLFNLFFSHTKTMSTLSLSLSLSLSVLFFFITLIKVDLHPTKWL